MSQDDLPEPLMSRREALKCHGGCNSQMYADMQRGKFPRPIPIGERARAWLPSEIKAWQQQRIAERDAKLIQHADKQENAAA